VRGILKEEDVSDYMLVSLCYYFKYTVKEDTVKRVGREDIWRVR